MHSEIRKQHKRTTKYTQPNAVLPQRLRVEAKGAKDSRAGNLDIETVFVVDEREIFDFVYDEAFKGIVENRQLLV
jgi:hypothetical protein